MKEFNIGKLKIQFYLIKGLKAGFDFEIEKSVCIYLGVLGIWIDYFNFFKKII